MSLSSPRSKQACLLNNADTLLILRKPALAPKPAPGQPGVVSDYLQSHDDVFVAICAHGKVLAFNGHVDLGTGIQTALSQIVADELDVRVDQVEMILGHTDASPNQGPTIASASIQISAVPLRKAAAQARQILLQRQADIWDVTPQEIEIKDGVLSGPKALKSTYWDLVKGQQLRAYLDDSMATKAVSALRLVGGSSPRVDIPAKALGNFTYVHDIKVPNMWHARMVHPPYTGRDSGDFIAHSLISVDEQSIKHISADIKVFTQGDFIGVIAKREEHAIQAARQLKVKWKPIPPLPDLVHLKQAIESQPMTSRVLKDTTDTNLTPSTDDLIALERNYVWPYQMHASIGPSCAVAIYDPEHAKIWSGTQNPHMLRTHLSELFDLDESKIEIIRHQASGCYGRNCADDVSADALLLSKLSGLPIRVQLSREQEHAWEPKGAAQLMKVKATATTAGELVHYDFTTHYPSNDAPLLAGLLIGKFSTTPRTLHMGDRTAVPPYAFASQRITCNDMAPIVRASWLRGVSALPNSFAHDCLIDELAHATQSDPVAFRIRHLKDDSRAQEMIAETARKAKWQEGLIGSRGQADAEGWMHGNGVAYARYIHSKFPGFGAAWSVWFVKLKVHQTTGKIKIKHLVVGQDTGQMINPDGVRHQIQGNVIQALSRALYEEVAFDHNGVMPLEWGAYPILKFTDLPPIEVVLMDRQDEAPLGSGESGSLPAGPAIANALFDATNIRFYEAPFTPKHICAALQQ